MVHEFVHSSATTRWLKLTVRASRSAGVVNAAFPVSGNPVPDSMLCAIRERDWDKISDAIADCEESEEIARAELRRGY